MEGLTSAQAKEALLQFGPNLLPQKQTISVFKILLTQVQNPLAYLLFGAIMLSFFVGDLVDGFLITAILVLNICLGFWQEYKASKELEALRRFEVGFARVIRDGKQIEIPFSEIVPGDLVILEAGVKVPADGQITEGYSLQINESVLTGESLPVVKSNGDEIFFGTTVASGRGKFKVLQTGVKTKFGRIALTLSSVEDEETPLEKALMNLSRGVGIGAVVVAGVIFVLRIIQGFEASEMLLMSIALMVAAVPEGLPAVVTIILSLGVRKMYQQKALVRKMIAVESLGAATVICTDKTGTLTKNEMRVKEVKSVKGMDERLMKCAILCNSANLVLKEDGGSFDILGDSTEGALLLWAKDKKIDIDLVRSEGKLIDEVPFSLQTRKMSTVWEQDGEKVTYTKGAPEVILASLKMPEKDRESWDQEYQEMAKKGLRVLAFLKDDNLLGLVGIADEIREEVRDAIRLTKQAGIKVVMVTGDNELTAKAVGEEIGLLNVGDEVLTGKQLEELSDEDLQDQIGKIRIFARITPEQKFRIVKTYQSLGEVVAVTGDGVNDALALKQAEVGVSMGKIGTDVSREASDIVLLDDNFATLVTAVEQGRVIYSNILKVVKFLMAGNLSEILLIGLAVVLGLPTPLLPTQILWINFVTDGLPALALGFDNPSKNIMKVPPRSNSNILGLSMVSYIIFAGSIISIACLAAFYITYSLHGLESARVTAFTTLVVLQMILPFIIRRHHSIFSNKKLLGSVVFVLIMQLLIITLPVLRQLFKI